MALSPDVIDRIAPARNARTLADRTYRADLDAADLRRRNLRGELDGLVEVARLDQIEPGELLLRLGERSVGHGQASIAATDGGRRRDGLEGFRGDALPARAQLRIEREAVPVIH